MHKSLWNISRVVFSKCEEDTRRYRLTNQQEYKVGLRTGIIAGTITIRWVKR